MRNVGLRAAGATLDERSTACFIDTRARHAPTTVRLPEWGASYSRVRQLCRKKTFKAWIAAA